MATLPDPAPFTVWPLSFSRLRLKFRLQTEQALTAGKATLRRFTNAPRETPGCSGASMSDYWLRNGPHENDRVHRIIPYSGQPEQGML
jgi:hypothetical protein